MKKILIALVVAAGALGAQADDATFSGSMLWGHCSTAQVPLMTRQPATMGEAMQLSKSAIKALAGCKITAIAVANGTGVKGGSVTELPITLFMTDSLGAEPSLSYSGVMPLSPSLEYTEYPLPEAITIRTDMEPVYFGCYGEVDPSKGTVLVTDGLINADAGEGDWIGAPDDEGQWTWLQMRADVGYCCVRLKIEGANLPANNVSILESHVPDYVASGGKGRVEMFLKNEAGNVINSVTVTYSVGGAAEQTAEITLPQSLIYNDYTSNVVGFDFTAPDKDASAASVKFRISGVNGSTVNQCNPADCSAEGYYVSLAPGKGFKKNMVAEISTGTWCGYCPIGFVGTSQMLAAHPDGSFIPIAVHTGDIMTVQAYSAFQSAFGSGAPYVVTNRNAGSFGVPNPTFRDMNSIYGEITSTPSAANVVIKGMTFDAKKRTLTVDSETTFALSETGSQYALAYVLTEDHVGPYEQRNYYSDEVPLYPVSLEGWSELPEYVDTTFSAVARNIRRYSGITGSIPEDITEGMAYSHSESIQTNFVDNINNCSVVVMVINRATGFIENAVIAPCNEYSAIREIAPAVPAAGAAFDLSGRRISGRPVRHGVYIIDNQKVFR